uniref:Uncharacterized protein n=1 Tax=viral metagenome TaxID=1070528 RepID=A0A6M3ISP0_9ZZZZ
MAFPEGWTAIGEKQTPDQKKFATYRQLGGTAFYDKWLAMGKPATPKEETPYEAPAVKRIREEKEAKGALPYPDEQGNYVNYPPGKVTMANDKVITLEEYKKSQELDIPDALSPGLPGTPAGYTGSDENDYWDQGVPPPNGKFSYKDGAGRIMVWNGIDNYIQGGFDASAVYQGEETKNVPPPNGVYQYDDGTGRIMVWDGQNSYIQGGFDPTKIYVDPGKKEAEQARLDREDRQFYEKLAQDREFALQEKQMGMAQLEQQRQQRLAELSANPMSWLQYAAEAGTMPGIQPWMLPLMPQQYSELGAGAAVPGYVQGPASKAYDEFQTGLQAKLGGGLEMGTSYNPAPLPGPVSMSGMPNLTPMSMQYWARMNPSSQSQYLGYEKARTGQTPEDTLSRMRAGAAPSGKFGGLSWKR